MTTDASSGSSPLWNMSNEFSRVVVPFAIAGTVWTATCELQKREFRTLFRDVELHESANETAIPLDALRRQWDWVADSGTLSMTLKLLYELPQSPQEEFSMNLWLKPVIPYS